MSPIIHLFHTEAPDGATAVAVDVSASLDTPKRDNSDTTSEATYTEDATDNVDSAMAAIAADMGFTIEGNGDFVPDDLRDLRHRFNYLKNLYDIKEQVRVDRFVAGFSSKSNKWQVKRWRDKLDKYWSRQHKTGYFGGGMLRHSPNYSYAMMKWRKRQSFTYSHVY